MELNDQITDSNRLEELGGSNYEIVDGEPNIKGWDVKNGDGEKIGEVDELLFNPASRNVRYLVVDLDDNELDLGDDRKVLIPIGVAELYGADMDEAGQEGIADDADTQESTVTNEPAFHNIRETDPADEVSAGGDETIGAADAAAYDPYDDGDVVVLTGVTAEQLRALPAYEKGNVTPQTEATIRGILEGIGAASTAGVADDFYSHEHFNEDRFYNRRNTGEKLPVINEDLSVGKREVETGGARITSRLVERPVQENINLREEHVNVERTAVNRPVTDADQPFTESEIEMTEHAEVPVVSKEARVVEEVSLNKEVEEREETIHDTVRNTEVDIEKLPANEKPGAGDSNQL